jgi:hypothetical protein
MLLEGVEMRQGVLWPALVLHLYRTLVTHFGVVRCGKHFDDSKEGLCVYWILANLRLDRKAAQWDLLGQTEVGG